jgi:hypothetical protein
MSTVNFLTFLLVNKKIFKDLNVCIQIQMSQK